MYYQTCFLNLLVPCIAANFTASQLHRLKGGTCTLGRITQRLLQLCTFVYPDIIYVCMHGLIQHQKDDYIGYILVGLVYDVWAS